MYIAKFVIFSCNPPFPIDICQVFEVPTYEIINVVNDTKSNILSKGDSALNRCLSD